MQQWRKLLAEPSDGDAWRYDAVSVGSQALANHFAVLRDRLADAYRHNDYDTAAALAADMDELLSDIAELTACEPTFRLENWLRAAESWADETGSPQYYRHNAWHIITTWGVSQNLNDYASRLWSGLVTHYYSKRWMIFTDEVLACIREGREYSQAAVDAKVDLFEKASVQEAAMLSDVPAAADVAAVCNELYVKWFRKEFTVMTWNVGVFSKNSEDSKGDAARLLLSQGVDAVALNELDSCNRRHSAYQLADFADSLGGWNYHFAGAFPFAGGSYGNGVACKSQIVKSFSLRLPKFDGDEPRSLAVIETEDFVLGAVHLDHKGDTARVAQVRLVSDWFKDNYCESGKPVLLCGDFNSLPDSPAVAALLEDWTALSGVAGAETGSVQSSGGAVGADGVQSTGVANGASGAQATGVTNGASGAQATGVADGDSRTQVNWSDDGTRESGTPRFAPTYPSDAPQKCIDYIFALNGSAPVNVLYCKVLNSDASDHLPVVVRLRTQ